MKIASLKYILVQSLQCVLTDITESTTDLRFIRRIVRDHSFRGCSAEETINLWPSVRRGEEKNIFPFQEQADVMFNSSLIYELEC